MSGFNADWLDLREPADAAARSASVMDAAVAHLAGYESVAVADLACGSGAMLRALAPRLGPRQRWTLIDHDDALLAHARRRLDLWADASEPFGDGLRLAKGGATIDAVFHAADLSREPLPNAATEADLVTATALFDLVGGGWLAGFTNRLAATRKPLYTTLSYDGRQSFAPPDPLDDVVVAAFNRHQRTDKGFGPALGPEAAAALADALRAADYSCVEGDSPWRLDGSHTPLLRSLVDGAARAAAEAPEPEPRAAAWAARRLAAPVTLEIGHRDLFAAPG